MALNDIGIDLGTKTIIISVEGRGIVLQEPTVAAIDIKSDEVLAIGEEAYKMVGKTPAHIKAIFPLEEGVISNYNVTKYLIKYFLQRVSTSHIVKPRVAICVPSSITGVENDAVIEAALNAGARQVFLIEEPMAAALGIGLDFTKPGGHMVIDIGGGTTDTAVVSLGGKVISRSLKVAGNTFDREIVKFLRIKYGLMVGEKSAEQLKIAIGCACKSLHFEEKYFIKGMSVRTHLPQKLELTTSDIFEPILACCEPILQVVHQTLEKTPPELSGDIYSEGIFLTGGGGMLRGLDTYLTEGLKVAVRVAEDPINCVVKGTILSLSMANQLESGFRDATPGIAKR